MAYMTKLEFKRKYYTDPNELYDIVKKSFETLLNSITEKGSSDKQKYEMFKNLKEIFGNDFEYLSLMLNPIRRVKYEERRNGKTLSEIIKEIRIKRRLNDRTKE